MKIVFKLKKKRKYQVLHMDTEAKTAEVTISPLSL
jgi:hypothetical protein